MRLPFFRSRSGSEPIRLPLPETVDMHFGVYFHAEGPMPAPEDLDSAVRAWIDRHTANPLRAALHAYLEHDFLSLAVEPREALRGPAVDDLRTSPEDAIERYERATHVIVISAPDMLLPPRAGLWCGIAAARAIAAVWDGAIFDPALIRLAPLEDLETDLPAIGHIVMTDHILIPYSVDERGAGWITTLGMSKFGLPNLEIRDTPPSLFSRLGHVLNATAQCLAETMMEASGGPVREVVLEPEMRLTLNDIARAHGAEAEDGPEEGVRGWTYVGLDYTGRGRRGLEPFISIVPPGGTKVDRAEWLYGIMNDLLGPEDPENCDYVPGDNERMEEAHHRAMAELPDVKRRFLAGLPPGEHLYVKYGFPIEDHHEYMWISVATWRHTRIHGRLANDPFERMDLRAGQNVDITEADVFDWMIEGPDETIEGNYTGRVAREEGFWEG